MWISKADYTALVSNCSRAETRADWMTVRINQLELELGAYKFDKTGIPVVVPTLIKESSFPVDEPAETSFEDLGDDLARKFGVQWDDYGRIAPVVG